MLVDTRRAKSCHRGFVALAHLFFEAAVTSTLLEDMSLKRLINPIFKYAAHDVR